MLLTPLESHLGYWLRYVSSHAMHALNTRLAVADVTSAEWIILRELYQHDAVVPSRMAVQLGITRGAVSKLIDRLVHKSLVTRMSSADDRRCQALALTDAGRELVPRLCEMADEHDAAFFGHLPADERMRIASVLKGIVLRSGLRSVPALQEPPDEASP